MSPTRPPPPDLPEVTPRRFVDLQLSLSSLISGIVAVGTFMVWMGYQAAQQTSNMQQLQLAMAKVEKRLDSQDGLRETLGEMRLQVRENTMRINEIDRMLKEKK